MLPRSHRTRAWSLTGEGARLVRDFPELRGRPPHPIASATAASLKTPHTLTVIRTHLAFVTDARRHGDEHGHLDWTPEVAHPLSDGDKLITDAVMHYTLISDDQRTKLKAFVEVDRTTMSSERLASKLIEYTGCGRTNHSPPDASVHGSQPLPMPSGCAGIPSSPASCPSSPKPPATSRQPD
ncbi:replication-relaxation family protein [Streptomyces sp. NPDC000878]